MGDIVRFQILKKRYDEDLYDEGVSVEDLVNESEADRAAADDALQIGEEFMINTSRFRVIRRDEGRWEMEKMNSWAELECIEDVNPKSLVGFVNEDYFEQDITDEEDSTISVFQKRHVPPHWSPLLKYELAGFRNIRRAEVTEIGIKSRVWAQMNGMCNFPAIPTSDELRDKFDKKDVNYSNGVQNQYFTRFSFFTLHIRNPANIEDPSDFSTWKKTKIVFAIKGNEPVDQYNYIRIRPEFPELYEYRLYPYNSGWATKKKEKVAQFDAEDVAWVLDVAKGEEFTLVKNVQGVGVFEISGVGRLIGVRCSVTSSLMLGKRDGDYKNADNSWCPSEDCDGLNGELKVELTGEDDATKGLGEKVDAFCLPNPCEEEEEIIPSIGARQSAFWNRLAAQEEDEVPDYIKDGFDVGCVECGGFRSTRNDISLNCVQKCTKTFEEANGGNYTFDDEGTCETGVEETRYQYDDDIEDPEEFRDGVKITKEGNGDYKVEARWYDFSEDFTDGQDQGKVIFSRTFKSDDWDITGNEDGPDRDNSSNKNSSAARLRFVAEVPVNGNKEDWLFRIGNCRRDCGEQGGDLDQEATYGTEGVYAIQRIKGVYKGLAGEGDCGGGDGDGDGGGDDEGRHGCDKPYWAIFEYATQVNEGSYYAGLISRSCDNGAEHQIVYVNESKKGDKITEYPDLAMMGLSLRATREFNSLEQPRLYLKGGMGVDSLTEMSVSDEFSVKSSTTLGTEPAEVQIVKSPRARTNAIEVRLKVRDCLRH